jgi:hypothetical protein
MSGLRKKASKSRPLSAQTLSEGVPDRAKSQTFMGLAKTRSRTNPLIRLTVDHCKSQIVRCS